MIAAREAAPRQSEMRVAGIDGIRFLLACWVLINHLGAPPILSFLDESFGNLEIPRVGFENVFNGQAAVALFFVISGFCIHFPFRGRRAPPKPLPFYARRNIRIVLPAVAACVLSPLVGIRLHDLTNSILWSLVCEEVYYLLYPLLGRIAQTMGWTGMFWISLCASITLLLHSPGSRYLSDFGLAWTWVVGLPYWISGCLLAERWETTKLLDHASPARLWGVRSLLLALASLSSVLMFHRGVGLPWSLMLVSAVGWIWIEKEAIATISAARPTLDKLGRFSYSVYLFHLFGMALSRRTFEFDRQGMLSWTFEFLAVLVICWILYVLVEKPAHRLARRFMKSMQVLGADQPGVATTTVVP